MTAAYLAAYQLTPRPRGGRPGPPPLRCGALFLLLPTGLSPVPRFTNPWPDTCTCHPHWERGLVGSTQGSIFGYG